MPVTLIILFQSRQYSGLFTEKALATNNSEHIVNVKAKSYNRERVMCMWGTAGSKKQITRVVNSGISKKEQQHT
jgi:hypothetical protein